METPPHKVPILASIARAIAIIVILGAAFGTFTILKQSNDFVDHTQSLIAVITIGIGSALLLFGFAEVVQLIATIEYNTAQQKNQAILDSLHRIEALLERRDK